MGQEQDYYLIHELTIRLFESYKFKNSINLIFVILYLKAQFIRLISMQQNFNLKQYFEGPHKVRNFQVLYKKKQATNVQIRNPVTLLLKKKSAKIYF